MVVFLPMVLSPTGGTSSFARKFQAGMHAAGHTVSFTYRPDYDVLLASPRAPWRYLKEARLAGKKIVHRLDGVYYPQTTAGWFYPLFNFPLRRIHRFFADVTIYQSKFSQKSCEYFLGTATHPTSIIYNGVDLEQFSPVGPQGPLKNNPEQHVILTASRFRRADQIEPVSAAFEYYRTHHYTNSKLVVIGNFEGRVQAVPQHYKAHSYVSFLGVVPNDTLAQYLRAADVFLFTHLNPPCPNNILEAMACGLPVVGMADGAMPELITSGQEGELMPTTGTAFYRPRRYDAAALAERIRCVLQNRPRYSQAARRRVEKDFGLEQMIRSYLAVLTAL